MDMTWMKQASCANEERDLWFPQVGGASRVARMICAGCPVKNECLDYALKHEEFGIWGGMSAEERNRYRRTHKVKFVSSERRVFI